MEAEDRTPLVPVVDAVLVAVGNCEKETVYSPVAIAVPAIGHFKD